MDNIAFITLAIVILLVALILIKYAYLGAIFLLAWAGEQGFIGIAAYFACWIFIFPFMLAACIITGAVVSRSDQPNSK